MRFKICGMRDSGSALTAAAHGADMLGFVFVNGVRRQLTPERGAEIIGEYRHALSTCPETIRPGDDSDTPRIVGLFANQPAEFINRVARLCGLDYAQLCGGEPAEMWDSLDIPIIRQVRVREDIPRRDAIGDALRQVREARAIGNLAVLDKHKEGALGGTGFAFDWNIARAIACDYDVLLAGGLTPENVSEAIAIARPWGVDVSSGVEIDGAKDADRIAAFAAAVRASEADS